MKPQPIAQAIPTSGLLTCLPAAEEAKYSARDLLSSLAQVGGAVSLCWMIHLIA